MRLTPIVYASLAVVCLFSTLAHGQGITIDGSQIQFPDGSKQTTAPNDYSSRTVILKPVVGFPALSGTNLRNALAGITATAAFPAQVILEPGTYDVGNTTLTIPANVSVSGAGIDVTVIRGNPGSGYVVETSGSNFISDLTIRHKGGTGLSEGRVLNTAGADVRLQNMRCHITGTFANAATLTGVSTLNGSNLEMTDCVVDILNVTANNVNATGISVTANPADLNADGLQITVNPNQNANLNIGINISGSSPVFVTGMRLFCTFAANLPERAINAGNAGLVNIRDSRLATSLGWSVFESGTNIHILGCELVGPTSGGTIVIRQSVDENFADLSTP